MNSTFTKATKRLGILMLTTFVLASCQKDLNKTTAEVQDDVLMDGNVNLKDMGRYGAAPLSEAYLKSVDYLTPSEYTQQIETLRPDLSKAEQSKQVNAIATQATSYYLPTPPVGDQGTEGSCVGWGVGYAAHSITRYLNNKVHQYNWAGACRSASYIYNQIKVAECGAGSYADDAIDLIATQGECSDSQMPYVNGGCYTQPTQQQRTWAATRKSAGGFAVNPSSVNDIKYYLSAKYPVPVMFTVNQSFYDIRNNNYVWSQLYGAAIAGHCVCIVGYDDATKQFKVQNSWGAAWGRSGYFYVTYANVAAGAFTWAACILPNPSAN